MISYFNDRVLTPEMMRAMIILYIGPHNRPDFSQDYLLSPILAPDILLSKFPKTYFLTGERDPLVDDTVIFAGRLRRVKAAMWASGGRRLEYRDSDALTDGFDEKAVAEVALIPGISHGFLQFPTVYPPAWRLIERTAGWVGEVFREAAAQRRRSRAEGKVHVNGVGLGVGDRGEKEEERERHHYRTESSGDEEKPLEMMSMTRLRAKSLREAGEGLGAQEKGKSDDVEREGKVRNGVPGTGAGGNDGGHSPAASDVESTVANANGAPGGGVVNGRRKKKTVARRARARAEEEDKSLVKLASTDDLLGRRMHGLAKGLTGTHGDPE
jgi:hypothetical protein